MVDTLSSKEVEEQLAHLDNWSVVDGKLKRVFKFDDFVRAFAFMAAAAIEAEKMNHHPEWANVYNKVTVNLITHEAKGITERDFGLAKKLDALAR
ncbi:MAG: 4a-hydroxytetrahydrobiopterin dehydratase [Woeseia sp.]